MTELVSLTRDETMPRRREAELRATVLREIVLPCAGAMLGSADYLIAGRQTVSMHASLPSH